MKYYEDGQWKDVQIKVANAIQNEYGESISDGYSQEYINGLNTYSTDEIRIGTWIDGKPLYRKVYNFGALPNSTNKQVDLNISNLNRIVRGYGYAYNGSQALMIPHVNDITLAFPNQAKIYINCTGNRSDYTECYIVLEYTKTTDTAPTRNVETRNIVVDDNDDEGEIVRGEET